MLQASNLIRTQSPFRAFASPAILKAYDRAGTVGARRPGMMNHADARRRFKTGGDGARQYTANDNQRDLDAVLAISQPMVQRVFTNSQFAANNTAQNQTLNFVLNNVGINTRLTIEFACRVTQAAAENLSKTAWGLANAFSNITVTDLSNYGRVNTTGRHLSALATLRRQAVFGGAYQVDSPVQMGSNYLVCQQPANVQGAVDMRMFFEVPLAYSDTDLRGAIFAAVTGAQWRLSCTINPNFIVASTATDLLNACFVSSTADVGLLSNVVVTVYQHYLDQFPRYSDGSAQVPAMSLAWNYLIQNTTVTGMAAGADFPIPYANARTFLSTMAILSQGGTTYNTGSDVNYWALQTANLSFPLLADPYMIALMNRNLVGDDYPPGAYMFDHRRKPIDTINYGNTQLVLNASAAAAGTYLEASYEMMAIQNQVINAGSLAAA